MNNEINLNSDLEQRINDLEISLRQHQHRSIDGTNPLGLSAINNLTGTGIVVKTATNTFTTVTAPVGTVVGTTDTQTLTNKRVTKRVGTTADTGTLTIDADSYDDYTVTALAQAMTIAAPTGTPTQGQVLVIRIKDNGTGRALTWNAIFRIIGTTLPSTTVASKYNYIGCKYNSTDTKWDVLGVNQEI